MIQRKFDWNLNYNLSIYIKYVLKNFKGTWTFLFSVILRSCTCLNCQLENSWINNKFLCCIFWLYLCNEMFQNSETRKNGDIRGRTTFSGEEIFITIMLIHIFLWYVYCCFHVCLAMGKQIIVKIAIMNGYGISFEYEWNEDKKIILHLSGIFISSLILKIRL